MLNVVEVKLIDKNHVIVRRLGYALTGELLEKFWLKSDGGWRRGHEGENYPDECRLKITERVEA